jgi:biotin operon repressor
MARKSSHVRHTDVESFSEDIPFLAEKSFPEIGEKESPRITVFIGKNTLKTKAQFAIFFYESFLKTITEYDLGKTDIKVLMAVLIYLSRGNVVSLTQATIATHLDITQAQVSKSFKSLKIAGLLLEDDNNSLFLNPQILAKENLRETKGSQAYRIAQQQTEHLKNF